MIDVGRFKSVIAITLYHAFSALCIWIMLIFSYTGVGALIPESLYTSTDVFVRSAYSLLTGVTQIIALVVMCYPIVNWVGDMCEVSINDISSSVTKTIGFSKKFLSGGLNAVSKNDTL